MIIHLNKKKSPEEQQIQTNKKTNKYNSDKNYRKIHKSQNKKMKTIYLKIIENKILLGP